MLKRFLTLALIATAACSSTSAPPVDKTSTPSAKDVSTPFPIDRGGEGSTPDTYKGLPLRLLDTGTPTVTPVNGIIGLVCIGMSNAKLECDDFIQRVKSQYASQVNQQVRIANCAVGGNAIERWIDPAHDGELWTHCTSTVLPQAGIQSGQVRVIWHKAADQFTTAANNSPLPLYPSSSSDYANFLDHLAKFAARVKTKFPSVQAVYTTSRSYGGFANTADRGEPLSYEEGHALNTWLASNAHVDGVWYGWGPYIWAPSCSSGITNKSNVCYVREDFVDDGVHPSDPGQAKISQMLHARLLKESWYHR